MCLYLALGPVTVKTLIGSLHLQLAEDLAMFEPPQLFDGLHTIGVDQGGGRGGTEIPLADL